MKSDEYILIIGLIVTNLAAGLGLAIPMAGMLAKTTGQQNKNLRYGTLLVGVYFLEGLAFVGGMCTQILTIGLAVIWGIILGLWWQGQAEPKQAIKTATGVSLYGCLPTVSFATILLLVWVIGGNGLLNAEQARNFGIPDFVPWPFNTTLGFCVALAAGTIILKTTITTGIVALIVRDKENASAGQLK